MGLFKEDEIVNVRMLIRLWIAEGFLKPSKTHNLEEVAEDYLKDLVDRNLILASWRKFINGKIELCKIHDVVRELCLNIVNKETFPCVLDNRQVEHWERLVKLEENYWLRPITLICSQRVLNGVNENLLEFGCDRLNLRYIGCRLSEECSPTFPLISPLWSLQTLFITTRPSELKTLVAPYEFWEMLQLRHVEIERFLLLPDPLPSDCDGLNQTNLQTLMNVRNFRLSEEVCKRISHIKKLSIEFNGVFDESEIDARCLHNLSRLHQLESLDCNFRYEPAYSGFARGLTFPNSLKELLCGSCLNWEELSNMAGLLPHLEALELICDAVIGSQLDSIEGHFDRLKSLGICRCNNLVNFNVDSSHFPALTNLTLTYMYKFKLPSSIGELPSLQHIELTMCSGSLAMSSMRVLVEQEQVYGNDGLRLKVAISSADSKIFRKQIEEEGLHSNNLLLHYLHGMKGEDQGYI